MKVAEANKRQVAQKPCDALHFQDGARPSSLAASADLRPIRPLLRLSLLGGVALYVGNHEIAIENRKANALIAYLALAPGMKESRERLATLLWSETEDAKARASLRQSLHVVRKAFDNAGLAGLSADKLQVSLDRSTLITDLDDAAASVDRGQPTDILIHRMRITDDFLSGYDDIDPSFSHWLRLERECVRQRFLRGLEAQLMDPLLPTEAIKRVARALLNLDPTNEAACQKLMCAFVDSGNVAGALIAYKQLWDCLDEEHDIEPSAATQAIVVAIKTGTYPPPINSSINPSFAPAHRMQALGPALINRWAPLRFLPSHPCLL
jgi:DNA-binding SARP family transcriptional activator